MKSPINADELIAAVSRYDGVTGFCKECGMEQGGCEPDAENYECEDCGEMAVTGAETLLLMGYAE